tara:strand:- start:2475 stop:3377 length:903 start_codon:yes stop_codon:yes gene_type:complete
MTTNTKEFDLVSGEIVFWSSTMTKKDDLELVDGYKSITWGTISKDDALKLALKERFGRDCLIRKNDKLNAMVVLKESVEDTRNDYFTRDIYRIVLEGDFDVSAYWQIEKAPADLEARVQNGRDIDWQPDLQLTELVDKYYGAVSAGRVSHHLGKILVEQFNAVRVRERGGAFFVPSCALDRLKTFAESLEKTGNVLYRCKCGTDPNTMRAIIDNARQQLEDQYAELKKELTEHNSAINCGDKSERKRAKKKRDRVQKELDALQETADAIQSAFEGSQNILQDINEDAEALEALAILQYIK